MIPPHTDPCLFDLANNPVTHMWIEHVIHIAHRIDETWMAASKTELLGAAMAWVVFGQDDKQLAEALGEEQGDDAISTLLYFNLLTPKQPTEGGATAQERNTP